MWTLSARLWLGVSMLILLVAEGFAANLPSDAELQEQGALIGRIRIDNQDRHAFGSHREFAAHSGDFTDGKDWRIGYSTGLRDRWVKRWTDGLSMDQQSFLPGIDGTGVAPLPADQRAALFHRLVTIPPISGRRHPLGLGRCHSYRLGNADWRTGGLRSSSIADRSAAGILGRPRR